MKIRLDLLLQHKGLADSRHRAQSMITAGIVRVDGETVTKASTQVSDQCTLEIAGRSLPYVSRGGLKLEAGLDFFQIDPTGMVCADIGASTGGFTDCLLQRGAAKVYALDVGYGQLAWKLRQDPRVVVMERTNARKLRAGDLPEPIDLAVIDASFISLKLLLPPVMTLFKKNVAILALIKPQFEVGKEKVGKGGVVKDGVLHDHVIAGVADFAATLNLDTIGVTPSPILGPKGNREFLVFLTGVTSAENEAAPAVT